MLADFNANGKAFATAGNVTNKFMSSKKLTKPIVAKSEIKKIIFGGRAKFT